MVCDVKVRQGRFIVTDSIADTMYTIYRYTSLDSSENLFLKAILQKEVYLYIISWLTVAQLEPSYDQIVIGTH